MRKYKILLIGLLVIVISSCKKEQQILINATVYVDDERTPANIAFLKADQESVIKNENTLADYFEGNPGHAKIYTEQFSEYLPAGDYIIAIQLPKSFLHSLEKVYTYRRVSTKGGKGSFENVMVFSSSKVGYYQEWTNKY